ncbi:MAG: hypothetical protein JWO05_2803 [Gemmatimonadetes bacterium]|nr:hypothetical protein [Gemmatimonadota bacterium]
MSRALFESRSTTMRWQRATRLGCVLVGCLALSSGCRAKEAARAPTAERVSSGGSAAPVDSALTVYVEWQRDWMLLSNRHKAEIDAATPAIVARNAPVDAGKLERDPAFTALLDRQREEMRALMARAPGGTSVEALGAALAGIGSGVLTDQGLRYVPGRNEAALASARAKYGDELVNRVLAREQWIVTTLASAAP